MLTPSGRRERGSVLLLMPAGVLIVIILAAITVDLSHLYLERRELLSATSAAANDAASAAVDIEAIRSGAGLEDAVDPGAAIAQAQATLAAQGVTGAADVRLVNDGGRLGVRVSVTRSVEYVFAPAVPGGPSSKAVTATSVAYLETG